ncbi:MAG: hypothetical protein GEV11_14300 [Streptosporangiales bacterium]|nr:hypothetical protein [Streptosporangiales bacterium]
MAAGAGCAALLLCAACTGPSLTRDAYRAQAAQTATMVLSAVRTGELAAAESAAGRIPGSSLEVVLGDAETDASSTQETFASRQPPEGTDGMREELTTLLDDATATLEDARIAARRGDRAALAAARADLHRLGTRLEDFEERAG